MQVELVHAQLKRAKGRADFQDIELYNDISTILSEESNNAESNAILERLAEKLSLKTQSEIKQETQALNQAFTDSKAEGKSERIDDMFLLLNRLKEIAVNDVTLRDMLETEKNTQTENLSSPIIPDDFRCPISLELMKDPVIVATGQVRLRFDI